MNKLAPKIDFKVSYLDLDEIPDNIDISIRLPEKRVPDETKRADDEAAKAAKRNKTTSLF